MDTVYITNSEIVQSDIYQKFLRENSGKGNLKIRAYAASEALPIQGLKITVSMVIDSWNVIFFEGSTDASGMIETLSLPAPKLDINNLVAPQTATYTITIADGEKEYFVNMYDGICVVQNINYVPGGKYGN